MTMMRNLNRLAVLSLAFLGGVPAASADGAVPPCPLDCDSLTKRFALPLEYELCAAKQEAAPFPGGLDLKKANEHMERWLLPVDKEKLSREGRLAENALCWAKLRKLSDGAVLTVVVPENRVDLVPQPQNLKGKGLGATMIRYCLYRGVDGHFQLTKKALSGRVDDDKLREQIADASELPDSYLWGTPAAHGQTKDGASKPSAKDLESAKTTYSERVLKYATSYRDACLGGQKLQAMNALGYLLHAVQDLSMHRGMTNGEHAYEMVQNLDNPDAKPKNVDRALEWSQEVLKTLKANNLEPQTCIGTKPLDLSSANWAEMAKAFGSTTKDGTFDAQLAFLALGATFTPTKPYAPSLWFSDNQAQTVFNALVVNVVKSVQRPASGEAQSAAAR